MSSNKHRKRMLFKETETPVTKRGSPVTTGSKATISKQVGNATSTQPKSSISHQAVTVTNSLTNNDLEHVSPYFVKSPLDDNTIQLTTKRSNLLSNYDQPCTDLARYLLGKKLVRLSESGNRLGGTIVETEAYLGGDDKASHSYNGKRTARNEAMFMQPGTAYVYNIYGMYCCINISSRGEGAAVLIRSLEVTEGDDTMRIHRGLKRSDHGTGFKTHELCNGPSKLTMALGITKTNSDQLNLSNSPQLWLEDGGHIEPVDIIATRRVGIEKYAEEWAEKPLRFYIRGKPSVSVRDKQAETINNRLAE